MSLPARRNQGETSLTVSDPFAEARHAQIDTELRIHQHFLDARALVEEDRIDSEAAEDALTAALYTELSFLKKGLAEAGQSATAIELVARKVERLANTNNHRYDRRFGG